MPDNTEIPEGALPSSGYAVKTPSGKNTISPVGNVTLGPTETNELLANMQQMIADRTGGYNQFMGGLKDAMAWASGGVKGPTEGLALRDAEKAKEAKELFDMRTQMAAHKAAQAQAANASQRYASLTPKPGVGGGAVDPTTGTIIPQAQLDREATFATDSEKLAARADYLKNAALETVKKQQSPAMADVVDIYVPGEGMVQMPKYMAEEYLKKDPKLQGIVNGERVPAAKAIAAATSTTPVQKTSFTEDDLSNPNVQKALSYLNITEGKPKANQTVGYNEFKDMSDHPRMAIAFNDKGDKSTAAGAYQMTADTWDEQKKKQGLKDFSEENQKRAALGLLGDIGALDAAKNGDWGKFKQLAGQRWAGIPGSTIGEKTGQRPKINPEAESLLGSSQTPTASLTSAPMSRADYERQKKETEQISSARIAEGEKGRTDVNSAREQSIETGNALNRIESTLNTPEGAKAVGVFQKPGVFSAFGKVLQNGIQAGNFGSVSFKEFDDAIRTAGGDQKTIDAAQRLARDFAQMQLNIAKRDLKGQGAVSDNERKIVSLVTGSTANSPKVLKEFVRWNKLRNDFDYQVGEELRNWERSNKNKPFDEFKNSDVYQKLEKGYIAKTDSLASSIGLSGEKSAQSTDNVDQYLQQYKSKAKK